MKKQTMDILENSFNIQKTTDGLENISNTQKSFLEKSIQHLPNTETRFACGGGATI